MRITNQIIQMIKSQKLIEINIFSCFYLSHGIDCNVDTDIQ